MRLVDASYITCQEQEMQQILREHPTLQRQLTLLLNGYRELVQSSLTEDVDRADRARALLKKEQEMQRLGIPLLNTANDWLKARGLL